MKKFLLILILYPMIQAMEKRILPDMFLAEKALDALGYRALDNPFLFQCIAQDLFKRNAHMTPQEIVRYYQLPDQKTGKTERSVLPSTIVQAVYRDYTILQCLDCLEETEYLAKKLFKGFFEDNKKTKHSIGNHLDVCYQAVIHQLNSYNSQDLHYILINSCEQNPQIECNTFFKISSIAREDNYINWQLCAKNFTARQTMNLQQVCLLVARTPKNKTYAAVAHNQGCYVIMIEQAKQEIFHDAFLSSLYAGKFLKFNTFINAIEFMIRTCIREMIS